MSKLYWRIFLAFWTVIILTTLLTSAVNALFFADGVDFTRAQTIRSSLDALSEQAERSLRSGGEDALRDWLRKRVDDSPLPMLIILAPDGREMLGRPVPPRIRDRSRAESTGPRRRSMGTLDRPLQAVDGTVYRMVVPRVRPRSGRWFVAQRWRRLYPVVLVLVSGVVCFGLARYLTRPIGAFRTAGQKIAGGDLSARVGSVVGARRDEFGALAGDFDHMADRIQALMAGQQRLLRDVSHELRSPLARLQAAAGIIRKTGVTDLDKNLDRIELETENLNALIGQILTMVRLQSTATIDARLTDLDELLQSIIADARFEGANDGRILEYDGCEGLELGIDAQLIYSAIENVVRNAVQHSRRTTRVRLARDGQLARIEVVDDGPGVAEADLAQLFEPFFTRSQGTKGHAPGAGIGLTIAHRAIGLHGGTIVAANSESAGLKMVIELPIGSAT